MLQVVKSTFIGKLVLKYIIKKFYATVGGEPHPGQPAGWPGCGSPPTVLPPRNGSELSAENGAPLNAGRHSVAAIRSAARPDGRVLAPAVRGLVSLFGISGGLAKLKGQPPRPQTS